MSVLFVRNAKISFQSIIQYKNKSDFEGLSSSHLSVYIRQCKHKITAGTQCEVINMFP